MTLDLSPALPLGATYRLDCLSVYDSSQPDSHPVWYMVHPLHPVSHGATDPLLSNRASYPFFFRTIHSVHLHFSAIAKIIKHFSWNWVVIISNGDETGEQESDLLSTYLRSEGICVEFIFKLNFDIDANTEKLTHVKMKNATSNIFVLCGTLDTYMMAVLQHFSYIFRHRTFLIPPSLMNQFDVTGYVCHINRQLTFSLGILPDISSGNATNTDFLFSDSYKRNWRAFLQQIHLSKHPNDVLLEDIWMLIHCCFLPHRRKNSYLTMLQDFDLPNCTGNESAKDLIYFQDSSFHSPISKAIATIADALSSMHSYLTQRFPENSMKPTEYRHKLHRHLKIDYDVVGEEKTERFNENGEMNIDYFIVNCMLDVNINKFQIVGHITSSTQQIHINSSLITWKKGKTFPEKLHYKVRGVIEHQVQVLFSSVLRTLDGASCWCHNSENCIKCSDTEWPNDEKTQCIPKVEEYLSYSDGLAIGLSSVSLLFSVITALIIVIFMRHQNTPIVKANNKNLSFILLGAIILSFFCVFLFIGRPVDGTCMLRQAWFGIIFSVAVSSVVAKTVMVSLAFKASKPGSKWKQIIGVKFSNCIVVLCTSVQMKISIVWMVLYPPFQELDTRSYKTKIIVQCNEGSVVFFYLIISYMGFLASVNFVIAYVARLLPESFNEAKYITFSMLMFCSVWIAMIPAYLSTKGKYMVAVEIFAILASNAGLLGCIFFPKCYIILFNPSMNKKSFILSH
ncbi:vomeronasal type-2 receptor 26-like [Gastrophryne carolinensis]